MKIIGRTNLVSALIEEPALDLFMLVNWNMCPKLIPPTERFAAGRAYMRLSSMVSQVAF